MKIKRGTIWESYGRKRRNFRGENKGGRTGKGSGAIIIECGSYNSLGPAYDIETSCTEWGKSCCHRLAKASFSECAVQLSVKYWEIPSLVAQLTSPFPNKNAERGGRRRAGMGRECLQIRFNPSRTLLFFKSCTKQKHHWAIWPLSGMLHVGLSVPVQ